MWFVSSNGPCQKQKQDSVGKKIYKMKFEFGKGKARLSFGGFFVGEGGSLGSNSGPFTC